MTPNASSGRQVRLATAGFSLFLAGQTLSQLGDRLNHVALIGVFGSGRPAAAGTIALAELAVAMTLPVLLFGAVSGVVADRWDRKRTLVACDVVRAGLVALIPVITRWTPAALPVNALVFGVFLTSLLNNTTRTAVVPDLVPSDRLLTANAVLTSTGRVATVAGVVFGGLIIEWGGWRRFGWGGYEAGFYLDAMTYLASAVFLMAIRLSPRPPRPAMTADARGAFAVAWRDIMEARRAVQDSGRLGFVMVAVTALAAVSGAVYALVPVIMQSGMNLGISRLGAVAAVLAAGVLVGAALTGMLKSERRRHATIAAGIGIVGALVVGVSLAGSFVALSVLAFLGGLFVAPVMVLLDTEIQEAAAPNLRGRVSSAREIIVNLAFVAAAVAAGLVVVGLERVGAGTWHRPCLAAAGCLAVVTAVTVLSPARWVRQESATDACPSSLSV